MYMLVYKFVVIDIFILLCYGNHPVAPLGFTIHWILGGE